MSTTDTRAAFEAWAASRLASIHRHKVAGHDLNGSYISVSTQAAWEAWQAATEAAKATGTAGELPPLPDFSVYRDDFRKELKHHCKEYGQACAEAVLCAPDGESWQHKFEETDRALLYWKAKAKQAEAARQPVVAVKTWQERKNADGITMFCEKPVHKYMLDEIAELRAALATRSLP